MKFAAVTLLAILGVASAGKPQLSVSHFIVRPFLFSGVLFVGSSWLMRANVQTNHFSPSLPSPYLSTLLLIHELIYPN